MSKDCIMCGNELKTVECSGRIKDMQVAFCDEHAELCENCETITCSVIKG